MLEMLFSVLVGTTVMISMVLLCVGCREKRKEKLTNNGSCNTAPPNHLPPPPVVVNLEEQPARTVSNGIDAKHNNDNGLSRCSSLSSQASVRITITNVAEDAVDVDKLDSPGTVSSGSMADRELPELPRIADSDGEHDYDVVDERNIKLPHSFIKPPSPQLLPDYDTLDNINLISAEYSCIPNTNGSPEYDTVDHAQRTLPVRTSAEYATIPETVQFRKPSYDCLPEMYTDRGVSRSDMDRAHTLPAVGRHSPRPFSEGFSLADTESLARSIDKQRSGSERKARENEDCVSVIYASINPEFRTNRQRSQEEKEQKYSMVSTTESEPPVPENPYAMLDNLLEDLKIPNPDAQSPTYDPHVYEEFENLRPTSDNIDDISPFSSVSRRLNPNPVLVNSSPFAVINSTRTNTGPASPITYVDNIDST